MELEGASSSNGTISWAVLYVNLYAYLRDFSTCLQLTRLWLEQYIHFAPAYNDGYLNDARAPATLYTL